VTAALAFDGVWVTYPRGAVAVRGASLVVRDGECVALVGESGSGKTTMARAALGLLPAGATVTGSIRVAGAEVVGADERALRRLRGLGVGYVPQDPFDACDPLRRVGHHVAEAWLAHGARPPAGAVARLVGRLGIPARRLRQRPHQWSGGMLQRATIAAAGAHEPPLTIADEPTSALDADRAGDILVALRQASRSLLLLTHDLRLVAAHADRIAVCYAGRIVETGDAGDVLERPRHPYTAALVAAVPRPDDGMPAPLEGAPPDPARPVPGCPFSPRCPLADDRCRDEPPLRDGVACWRAAP
jgi:peptide/nickel transport system ATP-binding protein